LAKIIHILIFSFFCKDLKGSETEAQKSKKEDGSEEETKSLVNSETSV